MNLKSCWLAFAATLCFGLTYGQNYQSYVLDNTIPYKWENFNPVVPTEVLALAGEDEVYVVNLPFSFRYFDSTYTTAFVGMNGYVSFGRNFSQSDFNREHLCTPVSQLYNPAGEQNSLNPDNFIAVFWDDLFLDPACMPVDGGTGKLAYRTVGTAPNRQFIIVWDYFVTSGDLLPCTSGSADFGAQVNVQVRLFEGTNVIEVHLKNNLLTSQEATIAVENIDGTYAEYAHCSANNPPPQGPMAYRFTPSLNPPVSAGPRTYCDAGGADCSNAPSENHITNVTLSSLRNRSTCGTNGYEDFTSVYPAKLDSGQAYQLTVNVPTFGNPAYMTRAWIDWDNDTVFSSDEMIQLVGYNDGVVAGEGIYTAVINVPDNTAPGLRRMRIRHGFTLNNMEACGPDELGEVEDYNVLVNSNVTTYCPATGPDCSQDPAADFIINATITTDGTDVVNNSGCNAGYGDFTNNKPLRVNWSNSNQYTITVKRKVITNNARAAAYVDWNQDNDFDEQGETFLGVTSPVDTTTTYVIDAPADPAIGITRLRIRTTSGLTVTAEDCGLQPGGEVEDYDVRIVDPTLNPPTCISTATPADAAINLCQNQTLSWGAVTGATGYKLSLVESNPTVVIVSDFNTTATSYVIGNPLKAGKTYNWIVVPYNADGDAFECDSMSFTIAAGGDPKADIQPAFDTIFQCTATPVAIDGNPSDGTTPYTHNWNGTDNSKLSDLTIANPTFLGASSGSYKYVYSVTDANNCSAKDSVVISIIPAVEAGTLAAEKTDICIGESTIFTHTGYAGNVEIQDSIAGQSWQPSTAIEISQNEYSTGVLTVTRYYRAIAFAGSCADTSSAIGVTIHALPSAPLVTASGPTTFCEGDSVTLNVTNKTTGLVWNDFLNTTGVKLVVKDAGSYSVKFTDGFGCSSTSTSTTVVTNASPNKPQIQVFGNANTCVGDQVTLFVNNPNNDDLEWNDVMMTMDDTLIVADPGSYHVTATKNGCSTMSDDVTLLFNYTPAKPVIRRVGPQYPCEGDEVKLISSYSSGILWNDGSFEDTMVVLTDGLFNVTYTDSKGCSAVSDDATVTFTPTPATPDILHVGDSLMSSVEGYIYQWVGPTGPISGASKRSIRPTQKGNYRVYVYTFEGCGSAPSPPFFYDNTGIADVQLEGVTVYPNPFRDKLLIENQNGSALQLTIFNTLGKELYSVKLTEAKNEIDLGQLAAGAYLVKISSGDLQLMQKVIKND